MGLTEIIKNTWDFRKHFLRRPFLTLTTLGILATFTSCGKNQSPTSIGSHENGTTIYGGGSYETFNGSTNNSGELVIYSELDEEEIEIRVNGPSGSSLGGKDVNYYNTEDGECMVSVFDDNLTFIPSYYNDSNCSINSSQSIINIIMDLYDYFEAGNFSVKFFDDLPNYDQNHVVNLLGIVYEGDWTFNQIKDYSDLLNSSAEILMYVSGGTVTPISAATNFFAEVVDGIDELIDIINEGLGTNISKNQPYEFYTIPPLNITFFLPKIQQTTYDIGDYVSVSQGNWWTYDCGPENLTVEVDGFKMISNVNVPILRQSNGIDIYQGFDGDEFKTFGLFGYPYGLVFYIPPILIGDSQINLGESYQTITRQNDIGPLETHTYTHLDFQNVSVPAGYFPNCLHVKNTLEVYGETATQYLWLSPEAGQVKIVDLMGNSIELLEAWVDGSHYGSPPTNSGPSSLKNIGIISFFSGSYFNQAIKETKK